MLSMVVTAVLLGFADALVCKMLNVSVFTCAIFHGTIVVALMAEIVKNIKTLSSSLEAEKFYIKVEKTNIAPVSYTHLTLPTNREV